MRVVLFTSDTRYPHEVVRAIAEAGDHLVHVATGPNPLRGAPDSWFDIGISVGYNHILKPHEIGAFYKGVVNMHPSLLPYCRGKYPAIWAMADGLPCGATLHWVDGGVDTGPVIAQMEFWYADDDVCCEIYDACWNAGVQMLCELWGRIRTGDAACIPQYEIERVPTWHRADELANPEQYFAMTAGEIRARLGKGGTDAGCNQE